MQSMVKAPKISVVNGQTPKKVLTCSHSHDHGSDIPLGESLPSIVDWVFEQNLVNNSSANTAIL